MQTNQPREEYMNDVKKGRGVGKIPAMVYISLRVSREVADYFAAMPNKSNAIRAVLNKHVKSQGETHAEESK